MRSFGSRVALETGDGEDAAEVADGVPVLDEKDVVSDSPPAPALEAGYRDSVLSIDFGEVPDREIQALLDETFSDVPDVRSESDNPQEAFIPRAPRVPHEFQNASDGTTNPPAKSGQMKQSGFRIKPKDFAARFRGFELPKSWNTGRLEGEKTVPPPSTTTCGGFELPKSWNTGRLEGEKTVPPPADYDQFVLRESLRCRMAGVLGGLEQLLSDFGTDTASKISRLRVALKLLMADSFFK